MVKKLPLRLLLCVWATFFVTHLFAQDRQVTGRIQDEGGAGMPGVSVLVKGTTRGTTSDAEGNFSIGVAGGSATLVFSSVGFETKEVPVTASTSTLTVSMTPDVRSLGEVVVTALGIERSAKTLTYSTQQISGKQLTDVRDANFVNTLSGKIAGVVITQGASGPGSATRVTLRGNRSISGNNNALFVVDGVPIDNTVQGQVGSDFGGINGSDGAANINPDDIESMNVLKGAAAAALYGSRAANGVIMITTKKGKAGRVSADINSGVVVESPFLLPALQNTYGQGNGGVNSDRASGSWGAQTTTYPNNIGDFFRNAISTNNSIGVSGGTENVQTYLSYTNNYNQGLLPNNDLSRHTLNLRINSQVSKRLTTDAKITYTNQQINNKPRSGEESAVVMNLYKIPRSVDLNQYRTFQDENGIPTYWTTSSIYMNPFWTINKTSDLERRNRTILLGSARYQLTDWLNIQGRVSFDRYDDRYNRSWADRTLLFAGPGGSYQDFTNDVLERNMDVIVSGNNQVGQDINISYNFGAGQTYKKFSQVGANATGLLVPNKFDLSFARALRQIAGFSEKELQYVFGTATFTYRDYLTLDMSARNDWSSTLPAPHSYFYPAFGANFILSDAMQMPDWVSFAKVRGSWAQVGNDTDPYLIAQTYSFSQGGTGGFISRDPTQPAISLKPEISSSTEFGVDLRFFGGRLGIDATYYNSNTVNQLLTLGLAPASGFSNQFINAGKINNRGVEFTITGKPLRSSDLNWDMTLNFARNVNTIVELHPDIKIAFLAGGFGRTAGPVVAEGGSYGDLYAQRWKRDEQGRFVVDANGKPVATSNEKIGNFNPKFTLGFNNQFSYKNFVASFLIDGRFGGVMTSGTQANLAFDGNADYTLANREGGWVLPAVTASGETNTKAIDAETFWTTVSGGRYSWGEFFTYSTTNVRLRELSLGYSFRTPANFFIKNARLSLVARNLFFLYRGYATLDIPGVEKRKLPFDPDVNIGAGNFQGVEYGNLPSSRTVGLNLKLGF
ncbi:SusC/RagA family TonB-linked outer membrane protein [Telluribacter sp. SYSU D00476]|uniref:SusC/RagA family TonB-linked outer membrane protein n=1 Tax=Telluribacter sp. SYSU D00476 TaxID=2811430 RepID=UPI001FF15227|nr:SusC/RagA family TonB-linked outer membrane protein [Telluribacter sp. SYSU D00476]